MCSRLTFGELSPQWFVLISLGIKCDIACVLSGVCFCARGVQRIFPIFKISCAKSESSKKILKCVHSIFSSCSGFIRLQRSVFVFFLNQCAIPQKVNHLPGISHSSLDLFFFFCTCITYLYCMLTALMEHLAWSCCGCSGWFVHFVAQWALGALLECVACCYKAIP